MKKKLLVLGYRAYGDWIYSLPAIMSLRDKYDLYIETNSKGFELLHDDPRIKSLSIWDMSKFSMEDWDRIVKERKEKLIAEIKPDRVIDLHKTIENSCIAESNQEEFDLPLEERRKLFGSKNFYENVFDACCVFMPDNFNKEGVYFSEENEAWGHRWRMKHENEFIVIVPIAGSCAHKVYPAMKQLTLKIVERYPNARIFLVGDATVKEAQWKHERIHGTAGELSMKQVIMMTKYADYVIGGETGVLVAAGMWGTPKTMLCTASSVYQCCKHHDNDYSLQSNAACSPCHKAIYGITDCDDIQFSGLDRVPYPKCVTGFGVEGLMGIVEKVYNKKNIYNKDYYDRFVERASSKIGEEIYLSRWDLIEKYCHGDMSLLDYGCASGAFHKSSRNGFKCDGFDVNPYSGFNKLPDECPDILTMWDVIEHLTDPIEELRKFPSKYLFISTPNVGAVKGDIKKWRHYRPGEHLHYFDIHSLRESMNELGYDILEHNFSEGQIRNPNEPNDIITIVAERRIK